MKVWALCSVCEFSKVRSWSKLIDGAWKFRAKRRPACFSPSLSIWSGNCGLPFQIKSQVSRLSRWKSLPYRSNWISLGRWIFHTVPEDGCLLSAIVILCAVCKLPMDLADSVVISCLTRCTDRCTGDLLARPSPVPSWNTAWKVYIAVNKFRSEACFSVPTGFVSVG